jgi:type II secretory pathway pseudopilin PulG
MSSIASARGFTLFETLVATGILITALAGVAQLFVLGTQLTRQASASGAALVAAQDKIESLRGLAFGYDDAGTAVTAPALASSPASSLDENLEPYADWIDAAGQAGTDAGAATFVRRWRISPVDAASPEAIAIEACVFRMPAGDRDHRSAEACLSTIRTRQP